MNRLFDSEVKLNLSDLNDLIDKETKITYCVDEYIRKQTKSYSKIVQINLYNLLNNFDRITSTLYNKKAHQDTISHEDKIETLASVQCELYYNIGLLKKN